MSVKTTIWWLSVLGAAAPLVAHAGPREFGLAELERAAAERHTTLARLRVTTEIGAGPPEAYQISAGKISAGDERGLMYGLLEAAEQLRIHGRLHDARGVPATPMRGVRKFLHNRDLEAGWYHSRERWQDYFALLARSRFNRFNLVFAHQTAYLAPPYPFWTDVPGFPQVRARGLAPEEQRRNLETLCFIARTAAEHGIDFTLGIWEHDVQQNQKPSVDGLTRQNIGPYSHAALKKVLATCPEIRSVQMRTNSESGIPADYQVEFYRDWVFRALREAGRPVTLDLRAWIMKPGLFQAALDAGVPLRVSAKYWAEFVGRPYQPAETFPNYSYMDFLRTERPYRFYWELWGLGSHRLLLWGDPEYVRRAVPTFRLSGSDGFEIDEPLSQKGYGNAPGTWGIFADGQQGRVSWRHEFERYWLFYMLWGRISYDAATPAEVWLAELRRRFGAAAQEALAAYRSASGVLNEIVATHMLDPNMYVWPEINPGGLIETYIDAQPSDWRMVAGVREAVRNRLAHAPSAKQTPIDTAARLERAAGEIEAAVAGARRKLGAGNAEWRSSESDFLVLAALARYHAHKARGAMGLEWFYETGDAGALRTARAEVEAGVAEWKKLVASTDGVYPDVMRFGPDDAGHWKQKLPWVEHDLAIVAARESILQRFGRFRAGFDFGPALPKGREAYLWRWSVEPRFTPVGPDATYDEARGHGFVGSGTREVSAPPELKDRKVTRAAGGSPADLHADALFVDALRGRGAQTFRIRTGPGTFAVSILKPDGSAEQRRATADGAGHLDVRLEGDPWTVSGIVVEGSGEPAAPAMSWPLPRPRPRIEHAPVRTGTAGKPITLSVRVVPASAARTVRLHYRPVNQLARFATLDAPANAATFTIPAEQVSPGYDLIYYFEVLHDDGGWFEPDPATQTPYHVVGIRR